MHRMNHPDGKRLLARVRGGDFAHAGEAESIALVWERLEKIPDQVCLDAGCGRGGTAAVVQAHRWARVIGMDVDETSIHRARENYPEIEFHAADIVRVGAMFPARFDLVYAFNAFYAFPDQAAALSSLRQAVRKGARLCLFDYVDRGGFRQSAFFQKPETRLWQPLQEDTLPDLLAKAGWRLEEFRGLDTEYHRWYEQLTERFHHLRDELRREFSAELIDYAADYYQGLLEAIARGELGGAISIAQAA